MNKPDDALLARLNKLSPAQREALLTKLKQQKLNKPARAESVKDLPIPRVERSDEENAAYPLSFAQQRLWFLEQLDPGAATYNIAGALRLHGNINESLLAQTFKRIIQRHESLRTVFIETTSGAQQRILDKLDWELEVQDLSARPNVIDTIISNEANTGFDISQGPLFRIKLFHISDKEQVLTIVMHHIISDSWTTQVLLGEVSRIYETLLKGASLAMPMPKIQYLDFAQWQRQYLQEEEARSQLDYWKEQLSDISNIHLPTDKPRPASLSYNGNYHRQQLPEGLCQRLQQFCQQQGTTLYNGLLAAFEVLLYRYTQQQDFCVGTPIAGRNHPDLEPLLGFFVNTLAIRCDIDTSDSFTSLLGKVKRRLIDAQSNQDIPFEQLVDAISSNRDSSYSPIFQVFFSYTPGQHQIMSLAGVAADFIPADTATSKFDLSLVVNDKGKGLSCHFEYNTDLFHAETIATMAGHFETLLEGLVQQPGHAINQLPLLSQTQTAVLLQAQRSAQYYPEADLASLFERQAQANPEQIAVTQGPQQKSYSQLNDDANRLAHYLQQQGVKTGDVLGLCFPPSLDLCTALLASIKLGATYVPMDPSYPAERLNYMVSNAGIEFLLTAKRVDTHDIQVGHALNIDTIDLQSQSTENLGLMIDIDQPLYIIFTSGSTGKPKAAVVTQRGELNLLHWYSNNFALNSQDKFLVFSAIGFDLTQKNLFAPLCYGAQLHFSEQEWYEPEALLHVIAEQGISWINCAPSAFYPLIDCCTNFKQLDSLKKLFFGGEPIRLSNLKQWLHSSYFHASITNMYGPTECTDIATSYTIHDASTHKDSIPIGVASANVQLYVLDQHLNLMPRGAIGELYIGGTSVGLGYLNNPELTAERFIESPFASGERLYRSGDLVRYKRNGNLEFIARVDDQIKIRGFRIELGEIESQLRRIPGISDAVVSVHSTHGQAQLLAYLCSHKPLEENRYYKRVLRQHLPEFMIPIAYFAIDRIPLTPNGKIDRSKLPAVDLTSLKQQDYVAPRNPVEADLTLIWQNLLEIEQIGVHDNFFELGGHSLLATQLLTRIRDGFDIELPLRTIFEVSTIEGLAEIINTMIMPTVADNNADDEDFEEGIL